MANAMKRDPKWEGACPRCGGPMPNSRHPGCYIGALSRYDNQTYVCSDCGEQEGLLQYAAASVGQDYVKRVVHPTLGRKPWVNPI